MPWPDTDQLYEAIEQTWPAARLWSRKGWTLRDGAGGGKRVSAATAIDEHADIRLAEAAMIGMGQTPLFMLRKNEDDLDERLDAQGYAVIDPVSVLTAPLDEMADTQPIFGRTVLVDADLAIMNELWARGGIGPARLAIMDRVRGPKTKLLSRAGDQAGAVGFVASHGGIAMLHSLEVAPEHRRKGLGRDLTLAAARWARDQGCDTFALLTTRANTGAIALYSGIGMTEAAGYHYRIRQT